VNQKLEGKNSDFRLIELFLLAYAEMLSISALFEMQASQ